MTIGLYRISATLATVALAWWISGKIGRNRPDFGRTWALSGPMAILSAALGISVLAAIFLLFTGENTALHFAGQTFTGGGGRDSWFFMDLAARQLQRAPETLLYQEIFFHQAWHFQYPITSLLGWNELRSFLHDSDKEVFHLLNAISFAWIGLSGLMSALILRISWTKIHGVQPAESRFATFLFLVEGILLAFLFYPLTYSWWLGQVQTTLTMLAIGSILAWQTNHKRLSGILIGLCCLVKPQWALSLVWGLFRKEYRFALGGLAVCAVAVLIAGEVYGFSQQLDYLHVLSALSRHGESFKDNQSVNGLVNRFLGNGGAWHVEYHWSPPYNPIVYWSTLISGLLLVGVIFINGRKREPTEKDFGMALLVLTIASPIAWVHHYGILLGVLAAWVPRLLVARPMGNATPQAISVLWCLMGQNFPWLVLVPESSFASLPLSYLFFSAIGFVAVALAASPVQVPAPLRALR